MSVVLDEVEVILDYQLVVAKGSGILSSLVLDYLKKGYELYGDPVISATFQYGQAVVLYGTE